MQLLIDEMQEAAASVTEFSPGFISGSALFEGDGFVNRGGRGSI